MATFEIVRARGNVERIGLAELPAADVWAVVRRAGCGLSETYAGTCIADAMECAQPDREDTWYTVWVEAPDAGAARAMRVPATAWREVHPDVVKRACGIMPTCSICRGYHGSEVQHACE